MQTFKHRDVVIKVNARGEFAGGGLTSPSLAALKRKLDERNGGNIEPFDGLVMDYKGRVRKVRVVGIARMRNRRWPEQTRFLEQVGTPGTEGAHRATLSATVYPCTVQTRQMFRMVKSEQRLRERFVEKSRKHEKKLAAMVAPILPE